jgi:hypothetical protein
MEKRHGKERQARKRRKGMERNDRLENGAKASEGTIGNGTEERHGKVRQAKESTVINYSGET